MKSVILFVVILFPFVSFSQNVIPSIMKITEINISKIPFVRSTGQGWDNGSAPDLFVILKYSNGESLSNQRDSKRQDVSPGDLPVGFFFSTPIEVYNLSRNIQIQIWDADAMSDDFIDQIEFSGESIIGSVQNGIPTEFILENKSKTISCSLKLDWSLPIGTLLIDKKYHSLLGEYSNDYTTLKLSDGFGKSKVKVSLSTVSKNCAGDYDGFGEFVTPNKIIIKDVENGCSLEITFNKSIASINEINCQNWHGFNCNFSGDLKKK